MSKLVLIESDELQNLIASTLKIVLKEILQKTKQQEEILTIDQACEILHLARPTIYTMTSKRRIPHMKTGKRLLFRRSDLESWLSNNKKESVDELMQH